MKFFFLPFVFLSISLITNAQITFQSQDDIERISSTNTFNDIPLQPHQNKIDIYLNGERPKQEFYKVRVIEINDASNYNDLLLHLQQKAQAEGFDGLMLLGERENVYQDNSIGSAITSGIVAGMTKQKDYHYIPPINTEHSLAAIGIKYKSKLNYTSSIIKTATINFNDSLKTVYEINFSLSGSMKQNKNIDEKNYFLQNISVFNHTDTFVKKNIFSLLPADSYNNENIVTAKMQDNSGNIKYIATYTNALSASNIEIKIPTPDGVNRYNVHYDLKDGVIQKRFISTGRKKSAVFVDTYNYNTEQKLIGFTRFDAKTNKEIFTVRYQFFSPSDLPVAEQ